MAPGVIVKAGETCERQRIAGGRRDDLLDELLPLLTADNLARLETFWRRITFLKRGHRHQRLSITDALASTPMGRAIAFRADRMAEMTTDEQVDFPAVKLTVPEKTLSPFLGRYVVYAQLVSVLPGILTGRSEQWGHHPAMIVFQPVLMTVAPLLMVFALISPILVLVLFITGHPHRTGSLWSIPLSIGLSFVELLALLPLVQ